MIPVFIISLAEATDRRKRIEQVFHDINLDFTFVDAVDGRSFNVLEQPIYDAPKRLRSFGKHLTGGDLGCILSHKKIYQNIVDNNIEQALIFEDDVILRPDFMKILQQLISLNLDYDMIRFLGSAKLERLKMRPVYDIDGTHWLTRHSGMPGGSHATLIRYSGAQKLLCHLDRNAFPIDALMGRCWQTGLNWYTVRPGLATQDLSFDSAIGESRFDNKKDISGLAKMVYPITRAWFKFCETVGKKYWYYATYFKDKKLRKKTDER